MKITTEVNYRVKKNEDFSEGNCELSQVSEDGVKNLLLEIGDVSIKVKRADLEKAMRIF
jgi:hypothetical protein